MDPTGEEISILMGFLSPVEGAGLLASTKSSPDICSIALFSPFYRSTGGFVFVCD